MQRLSAVALLVLLCWQMSGWYILHEVNRQAALQKSAYKPTQHAPLVLAVNNADLHLLQWVDKGKEFVLNGKWYDVADTEVCGNLTYFHCFADESDAQLSAYCHGTQNNQNGSKVPQAMRLKFVGLMYFVSDNRYSCNLLPVGKTPAVMAKASAFPPAPVTDVPTPPPQICIAV